MIYVPIKSKVFVDDDLKVVSQHERNSLPPHTKLDLEVTQEVAIVNVEELPSLCYHDVVRVTVSNAQNIRGHTVPSTGTTECLSSLL